MGWLYRPKLRSGKLSSKWWVKYYVNGRPVRESTGTEKESQARRFLKLREGAVATGAPIPPRIDRIIYDELAPTCASITRPQGAVRWWKWSSGSHTWTASSVVAGPRASGHLSLLPTWRSAKQR